MQDIYQYYFNAFKNDLQGLTDGRTKRQWYVGNTSRGADKAAQALLPQDDYSRDIALTAARDALNAFGFKYEDGQGRRWQPVKEGTTWNSKDASIVANSQAFAALEQAKKKPKATERTQIANINNVQQNAVTIAEGLVSALQQGQPIDAYVSMIPEDADDKFKSAFIYTIATKYPAKSPEVAKELQTLAQRHKQKADQYNAAQKDKLSWGDVSVLSGNEKTGGKK